MGADVAVAWVPVLIAPVLVVGVWQLVKDLIGGD